MAANTQTLAQHGRMLAEITTDVSHLKGRVDQIDGKLGRLTVGVHDIQLMLGVLIERDRGDAGESSAG